MNMRLTNFFFVLTNAGFWDAAGRSPRQCDPSEHRGQATHGSRPDGPVKEKVKGKVIRGGGNKRKRDDADDEAGDLERRRRTERYETLATFASAMGEYPRIATEDPLIQRRYPAEVLQQQIDDIIGPGRWDPDVGWIPEQQEEEAEFTPEEASEIEEWYDNLANGNENDGVQDAAAAAEPEEYQPNFDVPPPAQLRFIGYRQGGFDYRRSGIAGMDVPAGAPPFTRDQPYEILYQDAFGNIAAAPQAARTPISSSPPPAGAGRLSNNNNKKSGAGKLKALSDKDLVEGGKQVSCIDALIYEQLKKTSRALLAKDSPLCQFFPFMYNFI